MRLYVVQPYEYGYSLGVCCLFNEYKSVYNGVYNCSRLVSDV